MANSPQDIENALAEAKRELAEIQLAAKEAAQLADDSKAGYSLHEVPGVGRYAVPRYSGWKPLLRVINDPAADIDFSPEAYPSFDAIICNRFESPELVNPNHPDHGDLDDLRDNLAAVRNFLMDHYYVDTPAGMTPEKARKALETIADFVGRGLNNNYVFAGIIPNHHLDEPFIDLDKAKATGGDGAQYIYEKILEMQRRNDWKKPFAAIASLFGGQTPPDLMLPDADETHFTDWFEHDILAEEIAKHAHDHPTAEQVKARIAELEAMKAKTNAHSETDAKAAAIAAAAAASKPTDPLKEEQARIAQARAEQANAERASKRQFLNLARDLDSIGNYLMYSAANMQNMAHVSENVKREAIDIARDILRKLKVSFGHVNIMDGLKLAPQDDISTFGALKGVTAVYERMLAWGAGLNPGIMKHPSVMAATQSIGQLGYLAKLEALRFARAGGDMDYAQELTSQLRSAPPIFATANDARFNALIEKIERGMETLLSRVQNLDGHGAAVQNHREDPLGKTMDAPPSAGLSAQTGKQQGGQNQGAQRNAALQAAEQAHLLALQAQMARTNARQQQQAPADTANAQTSAQARPSVAAPSRSGLQQSRTQAKTQAPQTATVGAPSAAPKPVVPGQMNQAALRQQVLQAEQSKREQQEREQRDALKRQGDAIKIASAQKKAAAAMAATKIDQKTMTSLQGAFNMKGVQGAPINPTRPGAPMGQGKQFAAQLRPTAPALTPAATTPATPPPVKLDTMPDPNDPLKQPLAPLPPHMPQGRGR